MDHTSQLGASVCSGACNIGIWRKLQKVSVAKWQLLSKKSEFTGSCQTEKTTDKQQRGEETR